MWHAFMGRSQLESASERKMISLERTPSVTTTKPSSSVVPEAIERPNESAEDLRGPLGLNLLYAPSEPMIDFVFVHGLGGGSRKSWSKTSSPYHYWPKEWLPRDPDFKHVRIHSFGYTSNWSEKKNSVLSIRDFAHALLGELKHNPDIKVDDTRIVLIGHSMGGLIVKEACILANQDQIFGDLACRFHAIFFLATPHRGPNLPTLLKNIARVIYGNDLFVDALQRNSGTILAMNDTFRHYSKDLQLWSFYEAKESRILMSDTLVVDRSSATLGYAHERIALLNDDHRGVCKFEEPSDPGYKTLRNAFCATVTELILKYEVSSIRRAAARTDLRRLRALLGNVDRPVDDLLAFDDIRAAGSCKWLPSKDVFKKWRNGLPDALPFLWLVGNPGSGKSVLTSHVIRHLEEQKLHCSFFFFKHSTPTKSNIGDCLRSLAYQMCLLYPKVREKVLALEEDGYLSDEKNERKFWRTVFLDGIFRTKAFGTHYWVIDALDECVQTELVLSLLSGIETSIDLRIFISSRRTEDIERGFAAIREKCATLEMLAGDTIQDIELFVASKIDRLPVADNVDRQRLVAKLLTKSAGNFLWVKLVMGELENTWSIEAAEEVLNMIPSDMNSFYARILNNMSKDRASLKIAVAILTWTICAVRPLTTEELQCALELDIHETVYDIKKCLASVCGQLLFVDPESRVQVIHKTVQDFLLREDLSSDFSIRKEHGNLRLATVCFELLCGETFKAPKSWKTRLNAKTAPSREAALASYACIYFSDHLYHSSSSELPILDALFAFLNSNVLSWIEYIAKAGDLYHITRTATNMKAYLDRRFKHFPSMDIKVRIMEEWVVDLIRVSAKFRTSLLSSPASIHWLVPPMCPKESIIAKRFTTPNLGFSIKGTQETTWNDCLAQFDYHGAQATAVRCGTRFLAVGLSTGKVLLYHSVSCQLYRSLDHAERVKVVAFSNSDKLLASSSLRMVRVWDLSSGSQIHRYDTNHQALDLSFTSNSDFLLATTQGNYVSIWGLLEGCEDNKIVWNTNYEAPSTKIRHQQPPSLAVFSSDQNYVGVYCRGQPILVFDLENETFYGHCIRDVNPRAQGANAHCPVDTIAFNPNSEMKLIIAAYHDGELVVYDLCTLELRQRLPGINAHALACSPDGRTLVTGSPFGTIRIFNFAGRDMVNLNLIYSINACEEGIRSLGFSHDSLRFIDIWGSQCRVWEPAVLVRKDIHDGESRNELSNTTPTLPNTVEMKEGEITREITAIACHTSGDIIFCGRRDGAVTITSTHDAAELGTLCNHAKNISVTCIVWGAKENILTTADQSGRVILRKISGHQQQWSVSETLFDHKFPGPVVTILMDELNKYLLISGRGIEELWNHAGQKIISLSFPSDSCRRVIPHPLQRENFIVFEGDILRIYDWADYGEITKSEGIKNNRATQVKLADHLSNISYQGHSYIAEFISTTGVRSPSRLEIWQTSKIRADSDSITALPGFAGLGSRIEHVIAMDDTRLLYLDTDLWVCSIDTRSFATTQEANRHFFIPPDWRKSTGEFLFHFTSKNEFVFAKKNELVVIRRGLDFSEMVSLRTGQQPPENQLLNVP